MSGDDRQNSPSISRQNRPSATVTEVADAVGYADAKYFSRVFRKHLGIRPSDFRYLNKWG